MNTFTFSKAQQEKNYIRISVKMILVTTWQILILFGIIMSLESNANKIMDTNKENSIFIPWERKASINLMTVDIFSG